MTKVEDKENPKGNKRGEKVIYKGTLIRLSADFSAETLQSRLSGHDIFKMMKEKNLQCMLLYTVRLSFRIE